MSAIGAMLTVSVDRIYAMDGEDASFAARDAAPVPCLVLIDHHSLQQYGETARVTGKTVAVSVRAAQVPAMPRRGDTFAVTGGELAGRTLVVDSVLRSDALEHTVLAA